MLPWAHAGVTTFIKSTQTRRQARAGALGTCGSRHHLNSLTIASTIAIAVRLEPCGSRTTKYIEESVQAGDECEPAACEGLDARVLSAAAKTSRGSQPMLRPKTATGGCTRDSPSTGIADPLHGGIWVAQRATAGTPADSERKYTTSLGQFLFHARRCGIYQRNDKGLAQIFEEWGWFLSGSIRESGRAPHISNPYAEAGILAGRSRLLQVDERENERRAPPVQRGTVTASAGVRSF